MSVALLDHSRLSAEGERSAEQARLRRVLIVSPHFPPTNAPDHHRVRLALPHLAENGWAAEVLAVRAEHVEGVLDLDLARTVPKDCVVHRVAAIPAKWTRRFGVGNLALRAYRQLRLAGDALLASGRFDLVFFSTTQFGVLPLGPYWRKRHGIPYVLDFQDEWVGSYYQEHPEIKPPGGRIKYAGSQWLARQQEPRVMPDAAQIVSVSPRYIEHLLAAYPERPKELFHELAFGGAESDFAYLDQIDRRQDFFDPSDGRKHWVYVGRGGEDMHRATGAFFSALRRALDASLLKADELRVHFLGTSYAPKKLARKSFVHLAASHGLERIVTEETARIPYFTALRCLRDAHALIVPGSDDAGYAASKIFPYLLARRPLLAVFREESGVVKVLQETGAGTVVSFTEAQTRDELSERIFQSWMVNRAFEKTQRLKPEAFAAHRAETMTRRLSEIFNRSLVETR